MIGRGISSFVSFVAYPNIIPWSPAPSLSSGSSSPGSCCTSYDESTPCAMSGDCSSIATTTPHVVASKPHSEWV